MKKYYTPEIEEFHVGFEYERKEYPELDSSNWVKHTFDSLNDIYGGYEGETELSEICHSNIKVRVKYLDKEDIESLGFSQKPIGYELGLLSRTEWGAIQGDEMIKIQTYWTYDTEERENLVRIYKGTKYDYPYTEIFRGIIKNKSELKKLLKQLKIID